MCSGVMYEDTFAYHELYGEYLDTLNSGLQIPTDILVQWSTFCVIFFQAAKWKHLQNILHREVYAKLLKHFHFSVTPHPGNLHTHTPAQGDQGRF